MNKKILASMIAGTMMISSASAVMADEPDKSVLDIDLESVSTVGDDAELKKSLEGILGYAHSIHHSAGAIVRLTAMVSIGV